MIGSGSGSFGNQSSLFSKGGETRAKLRRRGLICPVFRGAGSASCHGPFFASLRLSIPMLRELAKHNFPLRCLPILGTGFFNALDRFGCGRTLHNPISRAKGSRPSETSRTVNENLGIRSNSLNDLLKAFQLIQRRRLAFTFRQNATPALSASATLYRGCCCSSSSNEITTANPWARRCWSSLSFIRKF